MADDKKKDAKGKTEKAPEKAPAQAPAPAQDAKKGKEKSEFDVDTKKKFTKTFFLLILFVLNIIMAAGTGTILIYTKFKAKKEKLTEKKIVTKLVTEAKEEILGPIYTLEEFKLNLADKEIEAMLRAQIELEFFDDAALKEAEKMTPIIRNAIINILTNKKKAEILTIRGKLFLRDQITKSINGLLNKGSVKYVYFSKFVIQ